jgi:hypothetical protein
VSECEIPQFYSTREVRAAKKHKCCECAAWIDKGEAHLYCVGKWFNRREVDAYRQHLICADACMMIRDEYNDRECIAFGELFEFLGGTDVHERRTDNKNKPLRDLLARIKNRERKTFRK